VKKVILDENLPVNLRHLLSGRQIAIIELPNTRLAEIKGYLSDIILAIRSAIPGSYTQIKP
jgi:hypothetical protein